MSEPQSAKHAPHAPEARQAPALLPATAVDGRMPGLVAAFSTGLPRRADAELAPLLRELAARHWRTPVDTAPAPLLLRQTHSPLVLELNGAGPSAAGEPPAADGAAAAVGLPRLLAVKTADCVPLLAVDCGLGRYAALHAGWRGTAAGILTNLLRAWRGAGSSLAGVHLELGPHIQGCCYEVQADCLAHFPDAERGGALRRPDGRSGGRTHLHLAAVLSAQAAREGVPGERVHISPHCTYCHREDGQAPYASYRRDTHAGRAFTGTNVGLIGMLGPR